MFDDDGAHNDGCDDSDDTLDVAVLVVFVLDVVLDDIVEWQSGSSINDEEGNELREVIEGKEREELKEREERGMIQSKLVVCELSGWGVCVSADEYDAWLREVSCFFFLHL